MKQQDMGRDRPISLDQMVDTIWDYTSIVEDRVLNSLRVVNQQAVNDYTWDNLLESAHLPERIVEFVHRTESNIRKL